MYCCGYSTSAQVVVRGPKPTTVLHSRKVRIDRAASDPFTTREVLAELLGTPLRGKRVVVQRYGETNHELQAELESEGADVTEIVTYHWALPEDTAPLLRLISALGRDKIDLVAFTSASQASNLFTVAQCDGKQESLKQSLGRTLVASIGPVCSVALRKLAVRVDIEAKPPKLGPFIEAINAALSDPRPLSFQTGVGTRALFAAADSLGVADVLLRLLEVSAGGRTGPQADCGTALAQGAHRPGRQRPFHDA